MRRCDGRALCEAKLKALTIANEMLYNPRAVQEFAQADRLRESLEVLRQLRESELGPAMDENVPWPRLDALSNP